MSIYRSVFLPRKKNKKNKGFYRFGVDNRSVIECTEGGAKCTIVMSKGVSSELRGKFDHKLDPKNRVSIPSEWRLGDECPVYLLEAKKEGKNIIKVLSPAQFKKWVDAIEAREMTMAQKDLIIGKLHADCVGATINTQGKLLIPKRMCERIRLDADVKLVGRGAYFELWEPSNFALAEQLELEKLAELNADLGIF